MKKPLLSLIALLVFVISTTTTPRDAFAVESPKRVKVADKKQNKAVQKVIKTLMTAIRYGKNDLAAKQLNFSGMAQSVLPNDWDKLTHAQQTELTKAFETVIRHTAFVKGKDVFKHLDAILYDDVRFIGGKAHCRSTIVINRNYKKAEIVIDYVLNKVTVPPRPSTRKKEKKAKQKWRVVDFVTVGQSTLLGIKEDAVDPILADKGVAGVLQAFRDKVAQVQGS